MPTVRFFGPIRDAVGARELDASCRTVAEVLDVVAARGTDAAAVLGACRVWVNGQPAEPGQLLGPRDEVAVLSPVSGG